MLATLNQSNGNKLSLPPQYQSPNYIYAVTITPSGSVSLVTYNSNVTPPTTYPVLKPAPPVTTPCQATLFNYSVSAAHPPVSNTNETLYLIRHAEAHPNADWENGNYVAAGQWRALALPGALKGKIDPDEVYSIDPAQVIASGYLDWPYVRPSLTVQPYAIANDLPYKLVSGFEMFDIANVTQDTIDFFFNDPQFSNHKILLAWEHEHFPPLANALLKSYGSSQTAPAWGETDYDSIWKITLDSAGNLTVDNSLCEGIDSTKLPPTAPLF
jgi:broad specificity phosphatase PhoE